jgi:glucokinase
MPTPGEAIRAYLAGVAAEGLPAVATGGGGAGGGHPGHRGRGELHQQRLALFGAGLGRPGLARLQVLNDFEALALSLPRLGPAQRHTRPAGWRRAAPAQTLAVVGPGTGLGVGGVLPTAAGWAAIAGEGGHVTLAAADEEEAALLAWVRRAMAMSRPSACCRAWACRCCTRRWRWPAGPSRHALVGRGS